VRHYLGVAGDAGITSEEIAVVQGICMAVAAGRVNTLMRQIDSEKNKSEDDVR